MNRLGKCTPQIRCKAFINCVHIKITRLKRSYSQLPNKLTTTVYWREFRHSSVTAKYTLRNVIHAETLITNFICLTDNDFRIVYFYQITFLCQFIKFISKGRFNPTTNSQVTCVEFGLHNIFG